MANYTLDRESDPPSVREETDIIVWAESFGSVDRTVNKTSVGDVTVSTVFLGVDHGYGGEVLLFETMVFGGEHDELQERYADWELAVRGHDEVVERVLGRGSQR